MTLEFKERNLNKLIKCLYKNKDKCKAGVDGTKIRCFCYAFNNGIHTCNADKIYKEIGSKK